MTLGNQLYNISNTEGITRDQWIAQFIEAIKGHKEEKLLLACLEQAKFGRTSLSFGRACIPPESLKTEGFHLEVDGSGFIYCWE